MTISIDQLHEAALEAAGGPSDFGEDSYMVGLRKLVDAATTSPHRGAVMDARLSQSIVSVLTSRLVSQAGWAKAPEVRSRPLAPQVVVIGLPRSGTTALHQIMAADPAYQWIPSWLAQLPRPRPARQDWPLDPLYQRKVADYRHHGPNMMHDVAPDDPEECLQLMCQSFHSMTWVSTQALPDYHEWFIAHDERPSYLRYADNLRLIADEDTTTPWLLKNPSHTFGLDAMLDTFPDAVFVHIHRDPTASIVSGCSLVASLTGTEGFFTAEELGQHRLHIWALAADRMKAARRTNPDRTIVDVDYRAFVADPVAAVRQIYGSLSRVLTPEAEAAMRQWVIDRPKDKHGAHRYEAEDFGLTKAAVRDRMADYIEHYGIDKKQ